MQKTKNDVAGYQEYCFYYEPCPICFGCRCFHVYCSSRCDRKCAPNMKKNVCTSKMHYPANFEKIILRPSITVNTEKKEENND